MKKLVIGFILFTSKSCLAQYEVDSTIKYKYQRLFENLPSKIKNGSELDSEWEFGILTSIRTDILRKEDVVLADSSIEVFKTIPQRGKKKPRNSSPTEEESINEKNPGFVFCKCNFIGDTLKMLSGIKVFSGFGITTMIYGDSVRAEYSELETEDVLRKTETDSLVKEVTVPATIEKLIVNIRPNKTIPELYGQLNICSEGFYDTRNTPGVKFVRKYVKLYFRCKIE